MHGGLISFTSTFFTFVDYMKPALRLSALMKLPSIYILTHDSVFVGEDGPTHEPIEQLSLIRSIPNFADFRPADTNELIGAWKAIMSFNQTPSALIASRQDLLELEGTNASQVKNGAYLVLKPKQDAEVVLFASGSEVALALDVAKKLNEQKVTTAVISIVSKFLLEKKGFSYYQKIVGQPKLRAVIEASEGMSLDTYISPEDLKFVIPGFGKCGRGDLVYQNLGFDADKISSKILTTLKTKK